MIWIILETVLWMIAMYTIPVGLLIMWNNEK
jgi:hypothetical protein